MMEGENKRSGRPQVYDGQKSELARKMEDRRQVANKSVIQERLIPSAKRKREQDNIMKMRSLEFVLGILILILIVALVYEVGFGHGTMKTRNERMAEQQTACIEEVSI